MAWPYPPEFMVPFPSLCGFWVLPSCGGSWVEPPPYSNDYMQELSAHLAIILISHLITDIPSREESYHLALEGWLKL